MAQINSLVNRFGKMAGWNSATFILFGRPVDGISEFSYDDDCPVTAVYGANNMPIGISDNENYTAKCSVTLFQEEVYAIMDAMPGGARISEMSPVDVIVEYEYNNRTYKDIIRNFMIRGFEKGVKQGDGTIGVKCKVFCTHIDWNVR
jgi:hypothetical protein